VSLQLSLFEDSVTVCLECGEQLKTLEGLRQPCSKTRSIHSVAPADYFKLYRNTDSNDQAPRQQA
jgi:hypothetical protein